MGWGTSPRSMHVQGKYQILVYDKHDKVVEFFQTSVREYLPILIETARNYCEKHNHDFPEAPYHYERYTRTSKEGGET